jgi:large subunit ribosomal protein L21
MYAIVKTGGKQYTVKPGDVLDVEKLDGEAGDKVSLDVIFLNDGKDVVTDADKLAKTTVTAEIVDQHKGDKQLIFKFKKRKGYKRTRGHRQQLTRLAIIDVNGEKAAAPAKKAAPAQEKAAQKEAPKKSAAKPAKAAAAAPAKETVDFDKMTVAALKDYAKEHDIKLPSGARKADIIETISNAE